MSQSKTRGIVLSRTLSGEADYICSIFTRDLGKERFVFKGLKKSSKRPRTASEPGTALDIIFYTGHSGRINTVSEFDIAASHHSLRKSSESIFTLYYMLELINATTGFGDINEKIYSLLAAGIDTLSKTSYPLHFLTFFTARYTALQGILPDTDSCSWCGCDGDTVLSLDPVTLKMSCSRCGDSGSRTTGAESTAFLRASLSTKFSEIDHSGFSDESVRSLLDAITAFVESYFGINIKSADMLGRTQAQVR